MDVVVDVAQGQVEIPHRPHGQLAAGAVPVLVHEQAQGIGVDVLDYFVDDEIIGKRGQVKKAAIVSPRSGQGRLQTVGVGADIVFLLRLYIVRGRVVIQIKKAVSPEGVGRVPAAVDAVDIAVDPDDIAAGHIVAVHLLGVEAGDGDAVTVALDFFQQHIDAEIVAVDDHFAKAAAAGVGPHPARHPVYQGVAQERFVAVRSVEDPVVFGRQPQKGDVAVFAVRLPRF